MIKYITFFIIGFVPMAFGTWRLRAHLFPEWALALGVVISYIATMLLTLGRPSLRVIFTAEITGLLLALVISLGFGVGLRDSGNCSALDTMFPERLNTIALGNCVGSLVREDFRLYDGADLVPLRALRAEASQKQIEVAVNARQTSPENIGFQKTLSRIVNLTVILRTADKSKREVSAAFLTRLLALLSPILLLPLIAIICFRLPVLRPFLPVPFLLIFFVLTFLLLGFRLYGSATDAQWLFFAFFSLLAFLPALLTIFLFARATTAHNTV